MGLLSGFNVTLFEVEILGQAARAAFSGAAIPHGWSVLTPQQLGLAPQYWDGLYFSNNGASAWRYAFLFYWNEPWWRRRQSDGGHRVLRVCWQIRRGAICCICFANHCQ